MLTIPVPLGDRSYEVVIGALAIQDMAAHLAGALGRVSGVAVLVDGTLSGLSPRVNELIVAIEQAFPRVARLELAGGEACKTFAQLERTCEWLASEGFDRSSAIISVGGGATSDHAGFAAAIYLRGINFALVPTTLLAMVDASVGGKTAVDLRAGKNLVGAFHQPKVVLADLTFLETLPPREQAAGMAEVVKAGLIADADLFAMLESKKGPVHTWAASDRADAIAASVRVKVEVVTEDERESGRRAILNFGHTLGHAIETASEYGLLHGEAVALGMLAALRLGELHGKTDPSLLGRCRQLLTELHLPTDAAAHLSEGTIKHVDVDKKRRSDAVKFVFVTRPGSAVLQDVPLATLRQQGPRLFET